jgi:uncharacterized protein (DUF924 family)
VSGKIRGFDKELPKNERRFVRIPLDYYEELIEIAIAIEKFDATYLPARGFDDGELDMFDMKMAPVRQALDRLKKAR